MIVEVQENESAAKIGRIPRAVNQISTDGGKIPTNALPCLAAGAASRIAVLSYVPLQLIFIGGSIEIQEFIGIPHMVEEFLKTIEADHQRGGIQTGVKADPFGTPEGFINKKMHMVLRIMDKPEG